MTLRQLQCLCYYSEAWSYALQKHPICNEVFFAFKDHPTCYSLSKKYSHNCFLTLQRLPIIPSDYEDFLEDVWATYSNHSENSIVALIQSEPPFKLAYNRGKNKAIYPIDMIYYYRRIYNEILL